jgi:hypothetical protein
MIGIDWLDLGRYRCGLKKEYQTALPDICVVGAVLCYCSKRVAIAAAEDAIAAIAMEK